MKEIDLSSADMTLLFHVNGKTYAPIMSKVNLDIIKLLASSSSEKLVEIEDLEELKLKVGASYD